MVSGLVASGPVPISLSREGFTPPFIPPHGPKMVVPRVGGASCCRSLAILFASFFQAQEKSPPRRPQEASWRPPRYFFKHLGPILAPPGGAKIGISPKRNANFSNSHTLEHERGRKGLGRGSRGPREAREADFDPFGGSKMGPSRGQKYLGRLQEASWGRLGGDFSWA